MTDVDVAVARRDCNDPVGTQMSDLSQNVRAEIAEVAPPERAVVLKISCSYPLLQCGIAEPRNGTGVGISPIRQNGATSRQSYRRVAALAPPGTRNGATILTSRDRCPM
jgi:hypothetical protein